MLLEVGVKKELLNADEYCQTVTRCTEEKKNMDARKKDTVLESE